MTSRDAGDRSSGHRVEARLEALDDDRLRLVLDDVYPDGRRSLFTHVELSRQELLSFSFSRELVSTLGENLLLRLGADF